MMRGYTSLGMVALALFAGSLCYGQTTNTQITGQVTDESGAIIPGASVRVVDPDRRLERTTETNQAGAYRVPFLEPGSYEITVQAEGFRPVSRSGITLELGQVARIDFVLQVGAVTETVEVTAEAVAIERETSSIGQVIDNKRIVEMPLNGRNVMSLVNLTAGVVPLNGNNAGFSETGNFSVSNLAIGGGRGSMNAIRLDGADNAAPERNEIAVSPSIDAVQEFVVTTNSASAEFGRTSGGVISIVTKSGTNELHGTLYHFLRNDAMDAQTAFTAVKAPVRYNQFGGTIGGPVVLPKLYKGKDRTFFFISYEGWRNRIPNNRLMTLPTAQQREGDFSDTRQANGNLIPIFDPFSTRRNPSGSGFVRDPYANNIVPRSAFDPISNRLIDEIPLPNRPPSNAVTNVNNYFEAASRAIDNDQWLGRFDHNLTESHRLMARLAYNLNVVDNGMQFGKPFLPNGPGNDKFTRNYWQLVTAWTHGLSASLVGDLRVGYVRTDIDRRPPGGAEEMDAFGYPSILPRVNFPQHTIQDMSTNVGGGTIVDGQLGNFNIIETMTYMHGRHTIKFGGEFRRIFRDRFQFQHLSGTFNFRRSLTSNPQRPGGTGWGVATFLTGAVDAGQLTTGSKRHERGNYGGIFIQDDWRISSRLTLNLGLRYDVETNPVDINDEKSVFNLDRVNPLTGVPGVLEYSGVEFDGTVVPTDWNNFAPRVGFAYTLDESGKTVMRGAYSIFYAPNFETFESNLGWSANTPFADPNLVGPTFRLSEGPSELIQPPGNSLGPAGFLGQGVFLRFPDDRVAYTQQWNLGFQRVLPGNWTVEGVYIGSKGTKIGIGGENDNLNQLHPQFLELGFALQDRVPNPFFEAGAFGRTVLRSQSLLPYPAYQGVTVTAPHWGSSSYHGVQLSARRRFTDGFTVLVSYTGGKLIDDIRASLSGFTGINTSAGGSQNVYNRRAERSVNPSDVSQRLAISSIVELPFGKGRKWLQSGPLEWVLGGWQTSFNLVGQTGQPVVVRGAQNNAADRPNSTGQSAKLPSSQRSASQWFDTNAFEAPPLFTYGNLGRALPDVRLPGIFQLDLGIHKQFVFNEKLRLQLRGEAFNATNHLNLGAPNANFLANSFGVINGVGTPARIIQVGAKLIF